MNTSWSEVFLLRTRRTCPRSEVAFNMAVTVDHAVVSFLDHQGPPGPGGPCNREWRAGSPSPTADTTRFRRVCRARPSPAWPVKSWERRVPVIAHGHGELLELHPLGFEGLPKLVLLGTSARVAHRLVVGRRPGAHRAVVDLEPNVHASEFLGMAGSDGRAARLGAARRANRDLFRIDAAMGGDELRIRAGA